MNVIKEIFNTINGQVSFVRVNLFLVLSPLILIFWAEFFYIVFKGKVIPIDGGLVALSGTVQLIVTGMFAYARTLESKEYQQQNQQPPPP